MRNETMIKKRPKGINWHTAIFMGLLHFGALLRSFRVMQFLGLARTIKLVSVAPAFPDMMELGPSKSEITA